MTGFTWDLGSRQPSCSIWGRPRHFVSHLWSKRFLSLTNLIEDDLACSVVIHVLRSGDRKVYMTKPENVEVMQMSINSVLSAGMDLAQQHGMKIRLNRGGKVIEL